MDESSISNNLLDLTHFNGKGNGVLCQGANFDQCEHDVT